MTVRESTEVIVDASTVYAEGRLSGLRLAAQIIGRHDERDIPPELTRLVRELRCTVYHNQWMHQHGHAVPLDQLPSRAELIGRIAAFLDLFPGESHEC